MRRIDDCVGKWEEEGRMSRRRKPKKTHLIINFPSVASAFFFPLELESVNGLIFFCNCAFSTIE
jgi:hypothetical protein